MISAFSLHLIKTERLPIELGKSFNKVEDIRLMADYLDTVLDTDKAQWAIDQAEMFVLTVKQVLLKL